MPSRISGQVPYRRWRQVVSVPSPAAGAEWSFPIPAGQVWHVLGVFAQLVTSAVVATRGPKLALSFGGGQYGVLGVGSTGVASNTYALAWVPGAGAAGAAGALTGPLPDLTLETGYTLGSLTLALDVGDQYSAVYILAEITEVRGGDVDLGDQPSMVVEVVASSTGS